MDATYCTGKYSHPGTGWYVMRNGIIYTSGTLRECKAFIARSSAYTEKHKELK